MKLRRFGVAKKMSAQHAGRKRHLSVERSEADRPAAHSAKKHRPSGGSVSEQPDSSLIPDGTVAISSLAIRQTVVEIDAEETPGSAAAAAAAPTRNALDNNSSNTADTNEMAGVDTGDADDEDGGESDDDDASSASSEPLERKVLPQRVTRGHRMSKLVGEAAEADEAFWNQAGGDRGVL